MELSEQTITPYVSYVTLGSVILIVCLMVLFKLAARDHRYLSNSELYIYARPDDNQRKNNMNKKPRRNTSLLLDVPPPPPPPTVPSSNTTALNK